MFTGLIAALGRLEVVAPSSGGLDLEIASEFRDLTDGESVAVDGACLTVTGSRDDRFRVHVVATTLARTLFASRGQGDAVNLERALCAADRLGGHFVQGHVDGIGTVTAVSDEADARLIDLSVPENVARLAFPRGSLAVDGVSMTVNEVLERGRVQLSVVPFTLERTTLGRLVVGDRVHLEADMLGKFVEQLRSWQKTESLEQ